jgi:hypothetical protein
LKDSEEGSQTTNTQTLTDSHRLSQTRHRLATESPQTTMTGIELSVHFTMKDLMTYPEMRKALQERELQYLANMAWLDQDLERLVEEDERKKKLYEENLSWLDKDLDEKVEERKKMVLSDLVETVSVKSQSVKERPSYMKTKIWHCGHGANKKGPEGRDQKELMKKFHDRGVKDNSCFIHHGMHTPEAREAAGRPNRQGFNTTKQFDRFWNTANEGDIIFTHCAKKGGLTHYGYYTGEITQDPSPDHYKAVLDGAVCSYIRVYEWFPLPQVLKGTGRNTTLYEVKPHNKNYQNYSIMS